MEQERPQEQMNRETQMYYLVLELCYDTEWGRRALSSLHWVTATGSLLCGDCPPNLALCPAPSSREAVTISPHLVTLFPGTARRAHT